MESDREKNQPMNDALRRGFAVRRQGAMRGLGRAQTAHPANQWLIDEINRAQGREPQTEQK